jgi:hypothetical protein
MSKGYGKIQRSLLTILAGDDRLFETFELTAWVFDVPPNEAGATLVTEAQLVSVRRALHKLASEGLIVDLGRRGQPAGRRLWASKRAAQGNTTAKRNRIKGFVRLVSRVPAPRATKRNTTTPSH